MVVVAVAVGASIRVSHCATAGKMRAGLSGM